MAMRSRHPHPMGRWLEQAGFKPDSRVCVLVQHGQSIITPLPAMP
ncbi:SymE family type I addiction module toxin [Caballeronia ptereochthonis]